MNNYRGYINLDASLFLKEIDGELHAYVEACHLYDDGHVRETRRITNIPHYELYGRVICYNWNFYFIYYPWRVWNTNEVSDFCCLLKSRFDVSDDGLVPVYKGYSRTIYMGDDKAMLNYDYEVFIKRRDLFISKYPDYTQEINSLFNDVIESVADYFEVSSFWIKRKLDMVELMADKIHNRTNSFEGKLQRTMEDLYFN